MKKHINNKPTGSWRPLARALGVISSVAVLATGVTFAALQSQQAVLAGNTVRTAHADLRISTTGSTYYDTRPGFTFNNIIPGVPPTPSDGFTFYLKNYGSPVLNLQLAVSSPVNAGNINLDKVHFIVSRNDGSFSQKFSYSSILAGNGTANYLGDALPGLQAVQYRVQVEMDQDAYSGQTADLTGFDLTFSGTTAAPAQAN